MVRGRCRPLGCGCYSDAKIDPSLSIFSRASPEPRAYAGEGLVGHDHRQPGLFHEQAVEVAQKRAAASQHHAFLGDVGAQFLGGVFSNADLTAETIWLSGSVKASRIFVGKW